MGRFYSGDIEGKFWVGVQSSDDADFFGVEGTQPEYLEYHYEQSDLDMVKDNLDICHKELGEYEAKLDDFFKDCQGYNDEMIVKHCDVTLEKAKSLLVWYARLQLGNKIAESLKDGDCQFEAEL
jgi:hypothetical protein